MAFNTNITVGRPPLLWSDVHDAFTKVNENFDILVATVGGGSGLTPIDFGSLDTDVSPTVASTYDLGSNTHAWKSLYVSEWGAASLDTVNGIWLGSAQIKGISSYIDLPANSTIDGTLIIDPNNTFFKEIQVDNNLSIVATQFADTFNLLSGSGITLTVSSGADSIQVDNTGILSIENGLGISHSTVSGVSTITNTGVRSLQSTTSLPTGRTSGAGINITASTGDNLKITNTGVISISSGVGITVSTDAATGDVTITNSAPAGYTFSQVQVNGDAINRLQADSTTDVLNINSGEGITLSKNTSTDTLTITIDPVFDLKGSIFGDDSSVLVDSVSGYIYGNVRATTLRTAETSIALGANAGSTTQGDQAVAVGNSSGITNQGQYAVAVGTGAGSSNQGTAAIAIGAAAGGLNQPANSIVLNASGIALNGSAAGFFVDPIRSTANGTPLMYNSTTKELFYSTVLEFIGSKISTSDSSGLTIDVQTTFNTDVIAENDLTVAEKLTVKGSRVINLAELQSLAAASSSFADFQAKIATLV